jgi:hypothetical protein
VIDQAFVLNPAPPPSLMTIKAFGLHMTGRIDEALKLSESLKWTEFPLTVMGRIVLAQSRNDGEDGELALRIIKEKFPSVVTDVRDYLERSNLEPTLAARASASQATKISRVNGCISIGPDPSSPEYAFAETQQGLADVIARNLFRHFHELRLLLSGQGARCFRLLMRDAAYRALRQDHTVNAAPAQEGICPLDDEPRLMAELQSEGRFDSDHQRGRLAEIRSVLARGPRRPFQALGDRVGRKARTNDLCPMRMQCGIGEAACAQQGGKARRDKIGKCLRTL